MQKYIQNKGQARRRRHRSGGGGMAGALGLAGSSRWAGRKQQRAGRKQQMAGRTQQTS